MARSQLPSHIGPAIVEHGQEPVIDIVFVHGLMGNRRKTWTANSPPSVDSRSSKSFWQKISGKKTSMPEETQAQQVFWPKDLLPDDIPRARIITYGYEAEIVDLFKSVSQNSLYAISRDILTDLRIVRESPVESSRPIIWIAHSLGGIVALTQSYALEQKQPHLFSIYSSTIGIVYLGTPHRGSAGASLGLVAASAASCLLQSPSKRLLRSLQSSSAELERISDSFSLLPRKVDKTIQEYSFQEDRGMASALPLIGGKIVPDSSSRLDDGVGNTSNIAANHRDMCKFTVPTGRDYRRIISVIKRLSEPAMIASSDPAALRDSTLDGPSIKSGTRGDLAETPECCRDKSKFQIPKPKSSSNILSTSDMYSGMAPITNLSNLGSEDDSQSQIREAKRLSSRRSRSPNGSKQSRRNPQHFFQLPLLDNPHFTGRQEHLEQLYRVFQVERPLASTSSCSKVSESLHCALLIGLGGSGKTEIALKYARLHRHDYSAVIWVDGTSPKTLNSTFARISSIFPTGLQGDHRNYNSNWRPSSSCLDLPATRYPHRNFKITDWLGDSLGYSWLVIIDNMDDPEMIDVVEAFLLQWQTGDVIITSRNREASRLGTAIQVSEMEHSEAVQLLLRSTRSAVQDNTLEASASRLATKLGNLPLAIDQASAYINYQQMYMDEYLALLEKEQAYLLGHSSRSRYHKTSRLEEGQYDTVLTTWEISFRHLQKNHLQAALLLQLFAFMNPEEISEMIFSDVSNRRPWQKYGLNGELVPLVPSDFGLDPNLTEILTSHICLREAIGSLLSFSLIRRKAETRSLSVHPLVHFWASWRMERQEKSLWLLRTATILNMTIPAGEQFPLEYVPESANLKILPHIQTVYEIASNSTLTQPVESLAHLLAYGSYYAPHPTSHQMFASARNHVQATGSPFLEMLVTSWAVAKSCSRLPPCCSGCKISIRLALNSLPDHTRDSQSWSYDNRSPALNALILRLAFTLEKARYECIRGGKHYGRLLNWIADASSSAGPKMNTERVVSCWRPTPSKRNSLEAEASMLQDLCNLTFRSARVEPASLGEVENKLLKCFTTFKSVKSFHEPIFRELAELSFIPERPFKSSLDAVFRLIKMSSEVDIIRVWKLIARATSEISVRACNHQEKSSMAELFHSIKKREDHEKLRGRGEIVSDVSDVTWASFLRFYNKFDTNTSQQILGEAKKEIRHFLLHPQTRKESLVVLYGLLKGQYQGDDEV